MKRLGKLFASCLSLAVLPQMWAEPVSAQSRWPTDSYRSNWPQPNLQFGTTPTPAGNDYRASPGEFSNLGYQPGISRGHQGQGGYHGGGHHHDHPFDDLNVGIILSPDWIGGWGVPPDSASGGYYAPGGAVYDQPILNQPPFYSGQPAPNFYQSPVPATGQSQYLTPGSGRATPLPGASTETPRSGAPVVQTEPNVRRRSILVRPESDPALSQTLAAGSPAESDYETSRTAFANGDYPAALKAAISGSTADPTNGKLLLYRAQCHFAVGEFEQSAEALSSAFQLLPPEQWGLVIENFRQFYKRNDYVKQFDALLDFSDQAGQQQLGAALQAYHYRYLGHPDAAAEQLQVALQAATPPQLASDLKLLIQLPATGASARLPAPVADN